MKTTTLLVSLALCGAIGCKKSDSATGSAGDPASGAAPGAALGAMGDFEGEIGVLAKSKSDKLPAAPMTVLVKAGRIRFDVPKTEGRPPTRGYFVMNSKEKKAIMVNDDQKTAMVFDASKFGSQLSQLGIPATPQAAAQQTPPKITKSGHSDTVAGYKCEDYDVETSDGRKARVCVSEAAAGWLDVFSNSTPGSMFWAKGFLDGQKFPLRMIAFEADGSEGSRMEVTKLEKKPLSDALFVVPPGYRTIDLDQMMNGLAGAIPPGMMPTGMPGTPGAPGQMPAAPGAPGQMPAMPQGMPGQMPAMTPAQRAQMEEAMKKMREAMEKQRGAAQPQP